MKWFYVDEAVYRENMGFLKGYALLGMFFVRNLECKSYHKFGQTTILRHPKMPGSSELMFETLKSIQQMKL